LFDTWGLRRHRDGRWDWVKAPYKDKTIGPIPRYQHSALFLGPLMMVVGGRTNTVGEVVPLEVYDTESSEWFKFNSVQRFRHSAWASSNNVYVHGGFEHETPNIPLKEICKIDTAKLFARHDFLAQKIKPPEKTGKDAKEKDKEIKTNKTGFYNMDRTFKLAS